MCEATVKCIPESRMTAANNMENNFFIQDWIRSLGRRVANKQPILRIASKKGAFNNELTTSVT